MSALQILLVIQVVLCSIQVGMNLSSYLSTKDRNAKTSNSNKKSKNRND